VLILRLGCAALAVLAAAACSSSTNGSGSTASSSFRAVASSPGSTSGSTPVGTPSTSSPSAVDPQTVNLQSLVLQRADVPSGWTAKTHTEDSSSDLEDREVIACLGSNIQPNAGRIQQVHSDDYDQGQSEITSDASSWQTAQNVQDQIGLITSPKADACFKQALEKQLASAPGLQVTVDIQPGAGGLPSDVVARLHAVVTYTDNGKLARLYFDTAFIAKGTVTAEVDFLGVGDQIPLGVSSGMVEAVAHRVANS
jgi:hypothetical protein